MFCADCRVFSAPSRSDEEHASSRRHHEVVMGQDDRRKRRYRLHFDNREDEVIMALSSIEAVALRDGGAESRMPYQITDETAIEEWRQSARSKELNTPLRDRIFGRFEDEVDEFTPRFTAREL